MAFGKKNFGVAERQREEGEECWFLSVVTIFVLLKKDSIRFNPFFVGFTVGSNANFSISRQLSLIGQNYGTLRMKCVLGETLRMKLVNSPNFEDKKCIFPNHKLSFKKHDIVGCHLYS